SACSFWSESLPLAACTSTLAPWSSAYLTSRSRSRCQRSSLRVSMEKPMVTGLPAAPAAGLPAPPPAGPSAGLPPQAKRVRARLTAAAELKRMAKGLHLGRAPHGGDEGDCRARLRWRVRPRQFIGTAGRVLP